MAQRDTAQRAEQTAEAHRQLQNEIAAADEGHPKDDDEKPPLQAGARHYPVPPFPKQHQPKPGQESKLDPAPMYDAPFYIGSEKLKGKVAIITGADSGIGRAVAVLFAREGADVAILYLDEHDDAKTTAAAVKKEGAARHRYFRRCQ